MLNNKTPMAFESSGFFKSDERFDNLYPFSLRSLSKKHWTPLSVARKAARFLAGERNARVLDIGSGIGKFCLVAAHFHPDALFFGIEQRRSLVYYADRTKHLLGIENATFRYGNFTQLDLADYEHFYFYNSFYENLTGTEKIDNMIDYSPSLFSYYNRYLFSQLEKKPSGTRLATYHSLEEEVPRSYREVRTEAGGLLKCWVKL